MLHFENEMDFDGLAQGEQKKVQTDSNFSGSKVKFAIFQHCGGMSQRITCSSERLNKK